MTKIRSTMKLIPMSDRRRRCIGSGIVQRACQAAKREIVDPGKTTGRCIRKTQR